jgi:hypothetical protein
MAVGRVFRSEREAALAAATGIVLAAVLASHSVVEHRDALHVMSWVLRTAAAAGFIAYRFFMAGAQETDTGLRVVNPFRPVHVRWSDIESLGVASYGRWPAVAVIELRNGRRIPIVAIRAATWRAETRSRVAQTL